MCNLNLCLDAVIAAIGPLTDTEQQVARLLCDMGDNPLDIAATIKHSRWLRFKRALEKLLGRPLTKDEAAQAKKLFREGKPPKEAAEKISPPLKQPTPKKPKI